MNSTHLRSSPACGRTTTRCSTVASKRTVGCPDWISRPAPHKPTAAAHLPPFSRAPWPHDFCRQACRRPRLRCTRTQASWRTTCWPAVCSRASIWTSPPPLTTGTSTRRAPRSPRRAAAWIAWVGAEPCTATVAAQRTTRLDGTIPAPASPPSLHLHLLFLLHHRLLYFLHHRESPSSLRSPPITPDLAPPGTPSWPRSTR